MLLVVFLRNGRFHVNAIWPYIYSHKSIIPFFIPTAKKTFSVKYFTPIKLNLISAIHLKYDTKFGAQIVA